MIDSDMKWKLVSDQALQFRCWNDEYVVYNTLSGDTHLLGSTAAQILLKLQEAPLNTAALAELLARIHDAEMEEELVLQTEYILADLDKLALIEHI